MRKNAECKNHIYDTTGFCEWERVTKDEKFIVRINLTKCDLCGNGKESEMIIKNTKAKNDSNDIRQK